MRWRFDGVMNSKASKQSIKQDGTRNEIKKKKYDDSGN